MRLFYTNFGRISALVIWLCTSQSNLNFEFSVDCQEYAFDMIEVVEEHFGAIEDCATYDLVYAQIYGLCETMKLDLD